MGKEAFDIAELSRMVTLYDQHFSDTPKSHSELYESDDAVIWDGYIKPVVELHDAIDSIVRFNRNIELVDVSAAYLSGGIEQLNLAQVCFVLRDILVNEKFHQGLFAGVIMNGKLERLMSRLKVLCAINE